MWNRNSCTWFVQANCLIALLFSASTTQALPSGTVPVINTFNIASANGLGVPLGLECVGNSFAVYDCVKQIVDYNTNNSDSDVKEISGLSGGPTYYEGTCIGFSGTPRTCSFGFYQNRSCPAGYVGHSQELYCVKAEDNRCSKSLGNPISVFTGEKRETSGDYSSTGIFPIDFTRYYHSKTKSVHEKVHGNAGCIGNNWDHTYSRAITGITREFKDYTWKLGTGTDTSLLQIVQHYYDNNPEQRPTYVTVHHPDGSEYQFSNVYNIYTECFESDEWAGNVPGAERLVMDDRCVAQSNYTFTAADQTIEVYSYDGVLIVYQSPTGITHELVYNSGKLTEINHATGDALVISYQGDYISEVTDSSNRVWQYRYDSNGNLQFVDNPDGTSIEYHYGYGAFPDVLTGVTDERGIRYSHFEYDYWGKANASYHGPQTAVLTERIQGIKINYNTDYGSSDQLINSNGYATKYRRRSYDGNTLPQSTIGFGCVTCGTAGEILYDYDTTSLTLNSVEINALLTQYNNYNESGKPELVTQAAGTAQQRTLAYSYDPLFPNKIATKIEPSVYSGGSKITTYGYDDYGNTTSITISGFKPDGTPVSRTQSFVYNGPYHQLSVIDGPRTDVDDSYSIEYYPDSAAQGNNRARMKKLTAPLGIVLHDNITYTPTGKQDFYTTGNNLQADYTYYPGNDRLETLTLTDLYTGETRATHWTYLASGEVEAVTQGYATPDATTVTFEYDEARRLTRVYDGFDNYIEYVLDTEGNVINESIFDQSGILQKALNQTFDAYSRLDISTQENETRDQNYAPDGTLDLETDGKDVVTDYSYDALRRLTSITQDLGGTEPSSANALTQFGYDVQDNLTSVTDPNGGQTVYVYDDLGNMLSLSSPDTDVKIFTHDEAGNTSTATDAKSQVFNYSYDALNRVILADAPGTGDDVSYTYDTCENGMGKLCSVTRGAVTVSYSYTAFGDIEATTQSVATFPPYEQAVAEVSNTYDTAGRIRDMIYPSGNKITYTYDAAGNTYSVILNDSEKNLVTSTEYYPFGPKSQITRGNGSTVFGYLDQAYRPFISGNGGYFYDVIYYDTNGNPTTFYSSEGNKVHNYDALDRLDTSSGPYGSRDYDYDTNGNRTSLTIDSVTESYSYDANSNRMNTNAGSAVVLDANGNTTNIDGMSISYTPDNRVSAIKDVASYSYNGLGERAIKALSAPGTAGTYGYTAKTAYVYGLDGKLLAETGSSGKVKQEYIYLNDELLATIIYEANGGESILNADMDSDGAIGVDDFLIWYFNHYIPGDVSRDVTGDALLDTTDMNLVLNCALSGGTAPGCVTSSYSRPIYYAHNDHLGTPHMLTDESGVTVWNAVYAPFGKATVNKDHDTDGNQVTLNIRFPGQYYDAESGLHYNYFRYYDPESGRYVTSDPIGLLAGTNTYNYVANNPNYYSDPFGLWSISVDAYAGIGGGITIGENPDGSGFISIRGGYGLGGGFSIDPDGKSPDYGCDNGSTFKDSSVSAGIFGGLNAAGGPAYIGVNTNAGLSTSGFNNYGPYINSPVFDSGASLDGKWGLRLSGSAGVQITFSGNNNVQLAQ